MLKGLNSLCSEPLFAACAAGAELRARPLGFVDIGARGGIHRLVEPLASCTAVLAFEPDAEEAARLRVGVAAQSSFAAFQVEPVALAGQEGTANLYRFVTPTNDSLLPENTHAVGRYKIQTFERTGVISIPTTTLDRVLFAEREQAENLGEFLKIDVQGAEYDLLQGAHRTLAERTVAIIVETAFFSFYNRQKLFSEVELFLRERGFAFYGFQDIHYRSCKSLSKLTEAGRERAFWADAVFFKDPLPMGSNPPSLSERGGYVLFACALLTGHYDFALELALRSWAHGDEAAHVEQLVHHVARLPPADTHRELMSLVERVKADPERANTEVGRFVDDRRHLNDYDDVLPSRRV